MKMYIKNEDNQAVEVNVEEIDGRVRISLGDTDIEFAYIEDIVSISFFQGGLLFDTLSTRVEDLLKNGPQES